MLSDQSRIIEQGKFIYSPLDKAFEKQIKIHWNQETKQVEALKSLKPEENHELKSTEEPFPKEIRPNEIKKEIYEIKIKRKDLIHKANDSIYDFQPFEMIRCFGDNTYTVKTSMDEAIF